MMKITCSVLLLSFLISVSSNPLSQLVQNICQPTSYRNPTSIPVGIQQTSNIDSYPQGTGQVSSGSQSTLGDNWNQIILNRILQNPSLQKIIDPNTKLYNQNGEEVQRQVPSTGAPNVINNYFIVPPGFFNLNETVVRNEGKTLVDMVDRKKRKKRPNIVELISAEEDETELKLKIPEKRQKQKEHENTKRKTKRIKEVNESVEVIDVHDELQELSLRRKKQNKKNEQRLRLKKKSKEKNTIPSSIIEESDEDLEELKKPTNQYKQKEIKRSRNPTTKSKKVIDDGSHEISKQTKPKQVNDKSLPRNTKKESESNTEIPFEKKGRKEQRKEFTAKNSEEKILKNIEVPTDISNHDISENRQSRNSKRKTAEEEPQNIKTTSKKGPQYTPFPDDVLKNWFPYMPMGNFNNLNSNNPYNFDQYYQYLDPDRNYNANKYKKKRKNQNRGNNDAKNSIEIKLKPKKKANITENPVTTEKLRAEHEVEQSTESFETVTDIPMEMPHKVSPVIKDAPKERNKKNYETFSKLEDLHELITPELGEEDEVPTMDDNIIINDYYPVFDVDVYYNPYAEQVKNLEDDRYFYDTENEDKMRERKKLDRYEDSRGPKRETYGRELENPDFKTKEYEKLDPHINKFDSDEFLDHIATFSDVKSPAIDTLKSSAEIRRVKVPSKNIRVKTENVETVFAGSKVAKYGVPLDETVEDTSIYAHDSDESTYSIDGRTTYVVAKSLGRPEDYW